MGPLSFKTRSLVLSAANVVVIVSTVRSTAGQTVFPLVPALVALSVVTLALAECCRLPARNA
jgi:hypothetical protein